MGTKEDANRRLKKLLDKKKASPYVRSVSKRLLKEKLKSKGF